MIEDYTVKYINEEDGDLYSISIVDDPANGFKFIALSNEKVQIKLASDKKKQILYGIVLRPQQKIYREFEDGTPFNLIFDAETIERLSQDFMLKGYQNNSTFNHEKELKLNDSTIVESWIVMNSENDKANNIGLPVENGDWIVGMKLSDVSWNEYIETGKAKGFSIDSFVKFEKISMKKIETVTIQNDSQNNKQNNMSILKKLIQMFSDEAKVDLVSIETSAGQLTADAFLVGNVVYNEDLSPVINGEFTADGKTYKTDETGTITEVTEIEVEETEETVEESVEDLKKKKELKMEDVESEVVAEVMITVEDIAEEVLKPVEEVDVEALKLKIEILTAEVEKLTKQQESVLNENVELKKLSTSTKLKAENVKAIAGAITMKANTLSQDSTLSAIEKITKKLNK